MREGILTNLADGDEGELKIKGPTLFKKYAFGLLTLYSYIKRHADTCHQTPTSWTASSMMTVSTRLAT